MLPYIDIKEVNNSQSITNCEAKTRNWLSYAHFLRKYHNKARYHGQQICLHVHVYMMIVVRYWSPYLSKRLINVYQFLLHIY